MIMYQRFLRRADGFLDCMQLLGKLEARSPLLEHRKGRAQMTFRAA